MISTYINKFLIRAILINLAGFTAGLVVFFLVLSSPLTGSLTSFPAQIVTENFLLLLSLVVLFTFAYLLPGRSGRWFRWILIALLFSLFLRGYWEIKRTAFFHVFGFEPWVDAAEYYANSQRILLGLPMQGSTNGRPMFSAFLSILLWITRNNLIQTITIITAMMGFVFFWTGEFLRKYGGAVIAAGVISFTFMFFRNYLGALSSESLGLILALPAWTIIYFSVSNTSLRLFSAGMFILTTAFVTRAGPLLVLPALILVGYFVFRSNGSFGKRTIYLLGPVIGGFSLNALLTQILSAGKSGNFTSYFYSLYGMAAGGKGWGFIKIAAPDIYYGLPEPERTNQIISATLDLIKADPGKLIRSMLSQYSYFLGNIDTSMFSYLFAKTSAFNLVLIIALYALIISGLIVILVKFRKKAAVWILGAVLIGILASIPLVPPQDESHMRPYAVVVPLLNLLPFLPVLAFPNLILIQRPAATKDSANQLNIASLAQFFGLCIAAIVVIPMLLFAISKPVTAQISCSVGETPFVAYHNDVNQIRITSKSKDASLNRISYDHLQRKLHDIYMSESLTIFNHLSETSSFEYVVNTNNQTAVWIIDDQNWLSKGIGWYRGCGIYDYDPRYYLFSSLNITSATKMDNIK